MTSILVAALANLADGDPDVLAVLVGAGLWRAAPPTIKQDVAVRAASECSGCRMIDARTRMLSAVYDRHRVTVCPLVFSLLARGYGVGTPSCRRRPARRQSRVNSVTGTLDSEVIAAGEGVEPLLLVSGIPRGVQALLGLLLCGA